MGYGIDGGILAIKGNSATKLQQVGLTKQQITVVSEKLQQVVDAVIGEMLKSSKFRNTFFNNPIGAIKKFKRDLMRFPGMGKMKPRASAKIAGVPVEKQSIAGVPVEKDR